MGILQKKTLEKFHEFEFGIQDNDSEPEWYRFSNLLPGKSKFLNHPTHPPKGLWEVTPVVLWWFWSDIINVTSEPLSKFFFRWVGGWKSHPPTNQKGFGRWHRWFFGVSEVTSSMSPWNHFWNCFSDPTTNSALGHPPANQQCGGRWHQWFCGGWVTSSM